mgnify:CR=1 FL=1
MNIEKILKDIPDKREWKTITSLKLKRDIYNFFNERDLHEASIVELGTHHGHTTRVLSFLFKEVVTYDIEDSDPPGFSKKLNKDRDNILYRYQDIYQFPWWEECGETQVVFIDTIHKYDEVCMDINNSLKLENLEYIIFDDYGMFPEVKRAVRNAVRDEKLIPVKYIGEKPGSDCRPGTLLQDWEGIICKSVS